MSFPLSYYEGLLTSEYQNSPNFQAWLNAVLSILDDCSTCVDSIDPQFNLSEATGTQLDTLGVIVGVSRVCPFTPSNGVSPILDDPTYRTLLLAQIGINQWTGQLSNIEDVWQTIFPGFGINVVDNEDMTLTFTLSGKFSSILQDLCQHGMIIPRPEGVLLNIIFPYPLIGTTANPVFAYDKNNSYCTVVLSGTPGTIIQNGVCEDTNNKFWDLPAFVQIGVGGVVTSIVVAEDAGVTAIANTIILIQTPVTGWAAVSNGVNTSWVGLAGYDVGYWS
jgi:hypothetical protein